MKFYINKTVSGDFDAVVEAITQNLSKEGFGILTQIDMQQTFKVKLQKDFRKYKILGACNPPFAFEALEHEDKIGTMLPCNVVIQEWAENEIEVSAVDPMVTLHVAENIGLDTIAHEVKEKLTRAIEAL